MEDWNRKGSLGEKRGMEKEEIKDEVTREGGRKEKEIREGRRERTNSVGVIEMLKRKMELEEEAAGVKGEGKRRIDASREAR